MISLNLPECDLNLKHDGKVVQVFDTQRRRFVKLTPEEWVRQHFVSFLITHLGYPAGLIGNEIALVQNGNKRRCDTVVAARNGSPLMIVEYKAPSVTITQEVFNQICRYNSVYHAQYLTVSNGLKHYCCRLHYEPEFKVEFLKEIPKYSEL